MVGPGYGSVSVERGALGWHGSLFLWRGTHARSSLAAVGQNLTECRAAKGPNATKVSEEAEHCIYLSNEVEAVREMISILSTIRWQLPITAVIAQLEFCSSAELIDVEIPPNNHFAVVSGEHLSQKVFWP